MQSIKNSWVEKSRKEYRAVDLKKISSDISYQVKSIPSSVNFSKTLRGVRK